MEEGDYFQNLTQAHHLITLKALSHQCSPVHVSGKATSWQHILDDSVFPPGLSNPHCKQKDTNIHLGRNLLLKQAQDF